MLKQITDPRWSAALFALAMVVFFLAVPLFVNTFVLHHPYFVQLMVLTLVAVVSLLAGFYAPILDFQFDPDARRFSLPALVIHIGAWGAFAVFVLVAFATAERIPLVAALEFRWTELDLIGMRDSFLKGRTGWQAGLVYVSAILTSTVLPYSLARLFVDGSPFRWAGFAIFLGYSLSFLQKVLFLQVMAPLGYLVAQRKLWTYTKGIAFIVACFGLMYVNTVLSKGTRAAFAPTYRPIQIAAFNWPPTTAVHPIYGAAERSYFGARYMPSGAMDHLIWRSVAVPVFTAADALRVFHERLDGKPLKGATSTFLAKLFGEPRVPFEQMVYSFQWGPRELARSNSVYFIEAFVNFGWVGVILISAFIGQSLRWFFKSNDDAFKALWPLYVFALLSSGFIGNMLSNGFVLLFAFALLCRVQAAGFAPALRSAGNVPVVAR